jgi:hypothetical protein
MEVRTMKTMGCLIPLFLMLAGCDEPARFVWTADSRAATLSQSDGMVTSAREYTFDTSTRRLSGQWTEHGRGSHQDEVLLTEDQAAHLVELLGRVRLDSTKPGDCWTDMPSLNLQLVEASGDTRLFYTDPDKNNCGSPHDFVVKEDVLTMLDACTTLLPEPPR